MFDVMETPLRDLSGDIIYEENAQGQLVPARRFSPDYWRDKYESFRLLQEMKQVSVRKQPPAPVPIGPPPRTREPIRWHDEWTQFRTLLRRAFMSKVRNRGNLLITAAWGTSLGLLISSVVADAKTAANFVPLVLIPQLIFGGALIKYEEMNRNLEVIETFKRWLSKHPEATAAGTRDDSALRVPLI